MSKYLKRFIRGAVQLSFAPVAAIGAIGFVIWAGLALGVALADAALEAIMDATEDDLE
jgi:hypothetical protein